MAAAASASASGMLQACISAHPQLASKSPSPAASLSTSSSFFGSANSRSISVSATTAGSRYAAKRGAAPTRCEVAVDGAAATVTVEEVEKPAAAAASEPIEKSFPAHEAIYDINKIREILPHRFPFLLVDRVIEYTPGVSAVAIKNITINDNFFPGHFPERPIMPGVLMVEAMAQVGGLVMLTDEVGGKKDSFFFAGVDKVRFRKPVVPGDTLVMRMTLVKLQKRFGIAKMEGKAYVGKDLVCEGEFLLALGS